MKKTWLLKPVKIIPNFALAIQNKTPKRRGPPHVQQALFLTAVSHVYSDPDKHYLMYEHERVPIAVCEREPSSIIAFALRWPPASLLSVFKLAPLMSRLEKYAKIYDCHHSAARSTKQHWMICLRCRTQEERRLHSPAGTLHSHRSFNSVPQNPLCSC